MDLRKRKFEYKKGRLIRRRKYPKPFRFVGVGIIVMVVLIIFLYIVIVGRGCS